MLGKEYLLNQFSNWKEIINYQANAIRIYNRKLTKEITKTYNREFDNPFIFLPSIKIVGDRVICNDISIEFHQNSIECLELFRVFLERPGYSFDRDELIHRLFISPKSNDALYQIPSCAPKLGARLLRLISKTRKIAHKATNNSDRGHWIDWFCWDREYRKWCFYRLMNSYLAHKESQLRALDLRQKTSLFY